MHTIYIYIQLYLLKIQERKRKTFISRNFIYPSAQCDKNPFTRKEQPDKSEKQRKSNFDLQT